MNTSHAIDHRVEVQPGELEIGKALPWAVYGRNGVLVAQAGFVVTDESKRKSLLESGLYREPQRLRLELGGTPNIRRDTVNDDKLSELRQSVEFAQLSIDLRGEPATTVLITEYIGKLNGQAVIVSAPPLPGRHSWRDIDQGTPISLRVLTGRSAYSFESQLLRFVALPVPVLFLRYPSVVRHQQVRSRVRVRTRLKAVALLKDGTRMSVSVDNISGDGCGIDTDMVLGEIGTSFDLLFRIELRGQGYTLTLPALIRNTRVRKGRRITGVAFAHENAPMDSSLLFALEAYLYEQIIAE